MINNINHLEFSALLSVFRMLQDFLDGKIDENYRVDTQVHPVILRYLEVSHLSILQALADNIKVYFAGSINKVYVCHAHTGGGSHFAPSKTPLKYSFLGGL